MAKRKRRQPKGEPSVLYVGCEPRPIEFGAPPYLGCVARGGGYKAKDVIVKVAVELEEKADNLVRYLSTKTQGMMYLRDLVVGRDADLLRYCLSRRLIRLLPAGSNDWRDGEGAALELPVETMLEPQERGAALAYVCVGPAGQAMLDVEFQEHRGNPERVAAAARRRQAFMEGR